MAMLGRDELIKNIESSRSTGEVLSCNDNWSQSHLGLGTALSSRLIRLLILSGFFHIDILAEPLLLSLRGQAYLWPPPKPKKNLTLKKPNLTFMPSLCPSIYGLNIPYVESNSFVLKFLTVCSFVILCCVQLSQFAALFFLLIFAEVFVV